MKSVVKINCNNVKMNFSIKYQGIMARSFWKFRPPYLAVSYTYCLNENGRVIATEIIVKISF